jgi:hypothetical protein
LLAGDDVRVEATWGIYQRMIADYRGPTAPMAGTPAALKAGELVLSFWCLVDRN